VKHAPAGAARLIAVVSGATQGRVVGVEREYTVLHGNRNVDARDLLPRMTAAGAAVDPGDGLARRGPWGGVVTADGRHAEVATPPVAIRPGCTVDLAHLASRGHAHLAAHLPQGCRLEGYSTHVNVEVDDRRVVRVARLVAQRLSAPLMLALERAGSPGLLVRPRPGRLEIGGEFAAGEQLRAAAALAIGVAALAERAGHPGVARRFVLDLPPARLEPAVQRYGWCVDRTAFGPDLYARGRATPLAQTTADEVLRRVWERARALVEGDLGAEDLRCVDLMVAGRSPIPLEHPLDDDGPTADIPPPRDYGPRQVGDIRVELVGATWWKALLRVSDSRQTRWVVIPGRALDAVLDALDAGILTSDLRLVLTTAAVRRAA
jgi:hypothetical protein